MSTTNKVQAYVIAEVLALDVPLPFINYLKPDGINYYTLNEIDGTSLLGYAVAIRKSDDGLFFIYSDSSFSYRKGHFLTLEQMGLDLGIRVEVLTTQLEVNLELSDSAGIDQISTWVGTENV